MDELEKHLEELMHKQNFKSLPAFEGYTPDDMQYILYDTFGKDSPIKLLKLSEADYKEIPLLNQIKYLMQIVESQGELKLTAKGFLPTKVVIDIYDQGFIKDEFVELGLAKVYKEMDLISINLTRILCEVSGVLKMQKNKLSISKKGAKLLKNDSELFLLIFTVFGSKFNWAYYDGYESERIGQLGFGFSLVLLQKYGDTKRLDSFYADKYFKAFPAALDEMKQDSILDKNDSAFRCYSIRTFDRFLAYFGLVDVDGKRFIESNKYITKTKLFDKLINCIPHKLN